MRIRVGTVLKTVGLGLLASVAVGSVYGGWVGLRSYQEGIKAADPSQKARILAQSISEGMNCAVFVAPITLPLAIALLVWSRRKR